MRPQIPKNVMHRTISMARVWCLEFILFRLLRGRKTLLGLDVKPTNFSDPETVSVARLTAFGGANSPEHPSWMTFFVFCGDKVQPWWDAVTSSTAGTK